MLALDVSGDGLFGRGDETNKGDSYLYKHASGGACFVHPGHTFGCERRSRSAASATALCCGGGTAVEQRAGSGARPPASGARPPDVEASSSDGQTLPSEGRRKAVERNPSRSRFQLQFFTNLSKERQSQWHASFVYFSTSFVYFFLLFCGADGTLEIRKNAP